MGARRARRMAAQFSNGQLSEVNQSIGGPYEEVAHFPRARAVRIGFGVRLQPRRAGEMQGAEGRRPEEVHRGCEEDEKVSTVIGGATLPIDPYLHTRSAAFPVIGR